MSTHQSQTIQPGGDDFVSRFRVIADYAPVMMWTTGIDKLNDWFSKPWHDFTGRSFEEERGEGWAKGVHPEDIDRCYEVYFKAFEARQPFSVDFRLLRHDGVYRWILGNGAPRYLSDGTFAGFIGSCTDIQDRKELEIEVTNKSEELMRSNQQLRSTIQESETRRRLHETILSATPDFIYIFEFGEDSHRFAYANERLLKMFGRSYEETVGKTFLEIGYEPWHAELHNREIDTVRATKEPLRGEVPFNGAYGRRIYDYIFAPVFDANGEVEAVAGITRDVTDRHETEEVLRKNEEAMSAAARRKDEFLAMLAHELRNPLAPISAANQIMTLSEFDERRVRKSSQIIDRQLKHMVGLIDDLLDVSRVTRGLVVIEKSPQDITSVISSSVEQVRPLLESKHHHLSLEMDSGPILVLGDHKRLVQIITNVLNNAAKYTQERGEITLSLKIQANTVVIDISDNGIGISKEDQKEIFELFAQAKRSSDRSQGGLGIGLALVKSMVELHDGTVGCASEGIGFGSHFTITLPLWTEQRLMQRNPETVQLKQQKRLSVLVVDDNVDAATTLASLLELSGHEVLVEHDSWSALDIVDKELPAICILDIGLPRMDGNELARRIKSKPSMHNVTLIAVTGYGQENDRQTAIESGFDHHLVKPVDYAELMKILEDVTSHIE